MTTTATHASLTPSELFPEVASRPELDELLARLDCAPAEAFASLLEAAGPLCRPERRQAAARLRDRLVDELHLPWSFAPFLLHVAADELTVLGERTQTAHLVPGLARQLVQQVHELALRPLVTLLRAASAAGELHGATPEARYDDFVARTLEPDFETDLAEEFPLLVPVLRRAVRRTSDHARRVLADLTADRPALVALGIDPDDEVSDLEFAAADRHRRGRSVVILTFASGRRLVHKPRDLAVDAGFQVLLAAVNRWAGTDLRTCGVVVRDDHGWMEHVATAAPDADGRTGYFERVGQLTAVLHLLRATDMHHSNVVCDGTGPVAIDLESLMHPRPGIDGSREETAEQVLGTSVQSIGILPTVVRNGASSIDLGGIGYCDGVLSPFKSLVVHQRGRDDMVLGLEQTVLRGREHAPTVAAEGPDVEDVATALDRGFTRVWDALAAHRDEAAALLRDELGHGHVRYIHNPTSWYAQLLRLVTGPRFCLDLSERLLALQRVGLSRPDADPRLARSELRDLAEGDVPYFSVPVGTTTVLDAEDRPVGDLLDLSPLAATLGRLDAMTPTERDRQRRLLRLTLVGKLPRTEDRTSTGEVPGRGRRTPAGPDLRAALATARAIGDDLVARQLPGTGPDAPATWIDPVIGATVEEDAWYPGVLGTGLYQGSLGPALLLAELARTTGSSRYGDAARRVLEPLAARLTTAAAEHPGGDPAEDPAPVGAYAGLSGASYALAVAGTALDDPHLIHAAASYLPALRTQVDRDRSFDLISGAAGVVAVALAVHARARTGTDRARCLQAATHAADHLLTHHPLGRGTHERAPGKGHTGFAHGTAGVHPVLRRLAALVPGPHARAWENAADRMAAHTRAHRHPHTRDWFTDTSRTRHTYAWCHGAPGIGLSHVALAEAGLPALPGAEEDLGWVAHQIVRRGLGNNLTYCHGDTGTVEILARTAAVTGHDALARTAARLAAHVADDVVPHHLASRRSRYVHSSCLMLGTSGVGHFLLRQIEPDDVPSVLTLD